jgi:hypothetical protein
VRCHVRLLKIALSAATLVAAEIDSCRIRKEYAWTPHISTNSSD